MFATRQHAFYDPFLAFLPDLELAVILLWRPQGHQSDADAGRLTAFYTYLLMLIGPIRMFGVALGMAQRATTSARGFRDPRPRPGDRRRHLARRGHGRVELRDVTFGYGDGPDVLHNVSLVVEPGPRSRWWARPGRQDHAGPAAAAVYDPRSGAVLIDGVTCATSTWSRCERDRGRRRRPVPVLGHGRGQHRLRAAFRVLEEIGLAAERAQATGFIDELPDGYETRVGERGLR